MENDVTHRRAPITSASWGAVCKDCLRNGRTAEFQYPDSWIRKVVDRGGSRSDRCPICRQEHARNAKAFAAPYVDLDVISLVENRDNPTGPLGGLGPLPTPHEFEVIETQPESFDFGLEDRDVQDLLTGLSRKQIAVVVAGTGSGKSTFLPYRLLMPPEGSTLRLADRGPIVVTVPRRAAAIDNATFVATKLSGSKVVGAGSEVGYRIQGEPAYDSGCRLLYVTDGSLINWLRDGSYKRFGAIIVDEAHERSKNIDIILGLLRVMLEEVPELRLIIASATIDESFFIISSVAERKSTFYQPPHSEEVGLRGTTMAGTGARPLVLAGTRHGRD